MTPIAKNTNPTVRRTFRFWYWSALLVASIMWNVAFFIVRPPSTAAGKGWVKTPCVIGSSELASQPGADGATNFSVRVLYRYTFDGRGYEFSHLHALTKPPQGRKASNKILRRYPPGHETVCFVNPGKPAEAFLKRSSFPLSLLSSFWLRLMMLVVSITAIAIMWRGGRRTPALSLGATRLEPALPSAPAASGKAPLPDLRPMETDSGLTPLFPAVVCALAGLLSSSAAVVFYVGVIGSELPSLALSVDQWMVVVFVVPLFALIGLGMLYLSAWAFLARFNPRLRIRISRRGLPLGETLEIQWHIADPARRVKRLTFTLQGREEAIHRVRSHKGPSTNAYDYHTILSLPLHEVIRGDDVRAGRVSVVIPLHLVPTFEAPHNNIVWKLVVQGEVPNWPDIREAIPLLLLPAQPDQTP